MWNISSDLIWLCNISEIIYIYIQHSKMMRNHLSHHLFLPPHTNPSFSLISLSFSNCFCLSSLRVGCPNWRGISRCRSFQHPLLPQCCCTLTAAPELPVALPCYMNQFLYIYNCYLLMLESFQLLLSEVSWLSMFCLFPWEEERDLRRLFSDTHGCNGTPHRPEM